MRNKLIASLLALTMVFTSNLSVFACETQQKTSPQAASRINYKTLGLSALISAVIAAASYLAGYKTGYNRGDSDYREAFDNKIINFVGGFGLPPALFSDVYDGEFSDTIKYIDKILNNEIPKLHTTEDFSGANIIAMGHLTNGCALSLYKFLKDYPESVKLFNEIKINSHVWDSLCKPNEKLRVGYLRGFLLETRDLMVKTASFLDNWKAEQANAQPKKDL
ncbi:MAG: hypothetical protein RUMPE_00914 [Eubacteriales bacterium SKADARSKE-1]|nr:hypothetical protein [Eubacteriales bacterium SKADARSKE-1]